jgi:hypothetical protein
MVMLLVRLLILLALAPSLASAQSTTIRDGDSATIRAGVTSEKRLKVDASGPVLSTSSSNTPDASDPLAFGRAFFLSSGLSSVDQGIGPAIFLDEVTVARLTAVQATGLLGVQFSGNGGKTWGDTVPTGFNPTPAFGTPFSVIQTGGASNRFVLGSSTTDTSLIATATNILGPWTLSTGTGPLTSSAGSGSVVAVSGGTVMAFASAGTNQTAQVCRSTDQGQTFGACVAINSATQSGPNTVAGSRQLLTSPAPSVWLLVDSTGKVWRSADDGSSWTMVLQTADVSFGGPIVCVSATTCLVIDNGTAPITVRISTDAGLTWGTTSTILGTSTNYLFKGMCAFSASVIDVFSSSSLPTTATATTVGAFRSVDGGLTWTPVNVFGGAVLAGGSLDSLASFVCRPTGRSFVSGRDGVSTFGWAGGTSVNGVMVVGANGIPLNIDGAGNLTIKELQAATGAVVADLVVTVTSQALVAAAATRLGIICTNGDGSNGIRVGFGATPTATSGFHLLPRAGFSDTGTYAINVIRDTAATANPTISCSTVSP